MKSLAKAYLRKYQLRRPPSGKKNGMAEILRHGHHQDGQFEQEPSRNCRKVTGPFGTRWLLALNSNLSGTTNPRRYQTACPDKLLACGRRPGQQEGVRRTIAMQLHCVVFHCKMPSTGRTPCRIFVATWMTSLCLSSTPTHSGNRTSRSLNASVTAISPCERATERPNGELCSGT